MQFKTICAVCPCVVCLETKTHVRIQLNQFSLTSLDIGCSLFQFHERAIQFIVLSIISSQYNVCSAYIDTLLCSTFTEVTHIFGVLETISLRLAHKCCSFFSFFNIFPFFCTKLPELIRERSISCVSVLCVWLSW